MGGDVCTEGSNRTGLISKDSGTTPNDTQNLFGHDFQANQVDQKTISGHGGTVFQIQYMAAPVETVPSIEKVRANLLD
jgi:hypothetical protein